MDNGCLTIVKLPDEQALKIVKELLAQPHFIFTEAVKSARGFACVMWIYKNKDKYPDLFWDYIDRLILCRVISDNPVYFQKAYIEFNCKLLNKKYLDWDGFDWNNRWEDERYIPFEQLKGKPKVEVVKPKPIKKTKETKSRNSILDEAKYYRNEILVFLYKEGKPRTRCQIESGIGLYTTDNSKKSAVKKRVNRYLNTLIDKNLIRRETRILSYNDSVVKYTLTEEGRKVVEDYLI